MAEYVVEFGKDGGRREPDGRLDAPAFHRNQEAICGVLAPFLAGKSGDALEVGSGTGQHIVEFARQFPEIMWWPSDLNEQHLASIEAWRMHSGLPNIQMPLRIDLSNPSWSADMRGKGGPGQLLAMFCANVIHIAPWAVAEGLVAGAGHYLVAGGMLLLYGPFKRGGADVGDDDLGARHGQPHRRLTAEAASAAGDQGDLAVKVTERIRHLVPLITGRVR